MKEFVFAKLSKILNQAIFIITIQELSTLSMIGELCEMIVELFGLQSSSLLRMTVSRSQDTQGSGVDNKGKHVYHFRGGR